MRLDKWQNSQLYWMNKLINMMQKYTEIFMKQPDNSELGSTKLLCDWTSLMSRIQMEAISRHAWDIKFVTQAMWADALIFCICYWIQFLKPQFYLMQWSAYASLFSFPLSSSPCHCKMISSDLEVCAVLGCYVVEIASRLWCFRTDCQSSLQGSSNSSWNT